MNGKQSKHKSVNATRSRRRLPLALERLSGNALLREPNYLGWLIAELNAGHGPTVRKRN